MKVAYLINQYPKPTHSFIRREIVALERHGLDVARLSIRPVAEPLVDDADRAEVRRTRVILAGRRLPLALGVSWAVLRRPLAFARAAALALRIGWRSDRGVLPHLGYLVEACVLRRWCVVEGIEHVHAHFGTNPAAVAMLCRVLGGPPYSFTVHGPEEFARGAGLALRDKIERAAFVVTVCAFNRDRLYQWCGRDQWTRIHIVHCGLDDAFLGQPPTAVPDTRRLVCVGRLTAEKGQLQLLDAAAQLQAEGEAFELVLIGDGPLRAPIEARIAALGLTERVRVTGWASSEEVRGQMLASRAVVLPSTAEGLPVVLMEAFALRRPVLCTRVAGVPELVEPGISGWVIAPDSVTALAAALRAVLHAAIAQLVQMGRHGAERVARRHHAMLEAGKLGALFQAKLAPGSSDPDVPADIDRSARGKAPAF